LQQVLTSLHDTSDADAATAAVERLGSLLKTLPAEQQTEGIARLAELRHDESWQVRRAAETALENIGTEQAKAALSQTAPKPDALIGRDKAQELFRRISGKTGEQWQTGEVPHVEDQEDEV
jgi:HEAT repeat protein